MDAQYLIDKIIKLHQYRADNFIYLMIIHFIMLSNQMLLYGLYLY